MDDGTFIAAAGLNAASKPSTKVMAPPGGRSNNIFAAGDSSPHTVNEGKKKRNTSTIFDMPTNTPNNITSKNTWNSSSLSNNNTNKSVNSNNSNSNNNNSSNVKKSVVGGVSEDGNGPPVVENAKAPGGGRASTKVMAPPGGKTSISFG